MDHLTAKTTELLIKRHRATYHREPYKVTKLIRRFFLRFPRSPYWFLAGSFGGVIISPAIYAIYKARTMSIDDFIDYRNKNNAVVMQRVRSGSHLYFPFLTKDIAKNQDDMTTEVLLKSTLPPTRVPQWVEKAKFKELEKERAKAMEMEKSD